MLAVVVTVQVLLLVPELTVTHFLNYLLSSRLCGQWSFQWSEQIVDCAVAWVTIVRDSESEYPSHPVGQFYWVRAGHLWCQMCSS